MNIINNNIGFSNRFGYTEAGPSNASMPMERSNKFQI